MTTLLNTSSLNSHMLTLGLNNCLLTICLRSSRNPIMIENKAGLFTVTDIFGGAQVDGHGPGRRGKGSEGIKVVMEGTSSITAITIPCS